MLIGDVGRDLKERIQSGVMRGCNSVCVGWVGVGGVYEREREKKEKKKKERKRERTKIVCVLVVHNVVCL